jgi:hypothetical protein
VLLVGCGPKTVHYAVTVVTTTCDPTLNPFEGAQYMQVRVSGPGIDKPIVHTSAASTGTLDVPEIPVGPNRIVEVRAYGADPTAGGPPLSLGRSLPFAVPDRVDPMMMNINLVVFLRKIDSFTPPSAPGAATCSQLREPRAGQTATLLPDGRVLIAGGFGLQGMPPAREALATTEFYDPSAGTFAKGPTMPQAKAFHAAVLLQSGEVFLQGGEEYPSPTPKPLNLGLFYDPSQPMYGTKTLRKDMTAILNRTQHVMLVNDQGRVLIAGGLGDNGMPVAQVEWYDWMTNDVALAAGPGLAAPLDVAGAPLEGGKKLALVGGADASGAITKTVSVYAYSDSAQGFAPLESVMLAHARRSAAAAARPDGSVAVVAGAGEPSSELLADDLAQGGPTVGARASPCAVALNDGTVMAIGGKSGTGALSDATATLIQFGASQSATPAAPLKRPRWGHTCTLLADGTVLVTGGVDDSTGTQTVLQDAFIYTPAPND